MLNNKAYFPITKTRFTTKSASQNKKWPFYWNDGFQYKPISDGLNLTHHKEDCWGSAN